MVLEHEILPFWQWLVIAVRSFGAAALSIGLLAVFCGFLISSLRYGPVYAVRRTVGMLAVGIRELFEISPRRVLAMASLAFKESIRRRVLVVIAVFLVVLSFAAWFLNRSSDHPARLYLSFVLTAANYLVIPLSVFLATLSIPNDIKQRTIYTVVTKPVRGWEILLGRMIGFCAIGSFILALMCLFSLIFVTRGLRHDHTIDTTQLVSESREVDGKRTTIQRGQTSLNSSHRHEVLLGADGRGQVEPTHDHTHPLDATTGSQTTLTVGPAEGLLQARVPVRGTLRFLNARGEPAERGINVGYETKYRSYVEGGTLAAAIWTFEGITREEFPDGLPLEISIRVFRSYKGEIERGILGTLEVVRPAPRDADGNPIGVDGGLRSVEMSFQAQEYVAMERPIPRELEVREPNGTVRTADLFKELVDPETGRIEVWIRCSEPEQYFGAAPADVYLHAADRPFWANLVKGFLSLWFQMVVVTCFGVTFSTVLSGPVAMFATFASMIMGYNKGFVADVVSGDAPGGGPLESTVRLITQTNLMVELPPGIQTTIIQNIDFVLMRVIRALTQALPNCDSFNTGNFVAYGFDVPGNLVSQHLATTLAYALAVLVAGYFLFRAREIAS